MSNSLISNLRFSRTIFLSPWYKSTLKGPVTFYGWGGGGHPKIFELKGGGGGIPKVEGGRGFLQVNVLVWWGTQGKLEGGHAKCLIQNHSPPLPIKNEQSLISRTSLKIWSLKWKMVLQNSETLIIFTWLSSFARYMYLYLFFNSFRMPQNCSVSLCLRREQKFPFKNSDVFFAWET